MITLDIAPSLQNIRDRIQGNSLFDAVQKGRQAGFQYAQQQNALSQIARANEARPLAGAALNGDINALKQLNMVDPTQGQEVAKYAQLDPASLHQKAAAMLYAVKDQGPQAWTNAVNQIGQMTGHAPDPEELDYNNREATVAKFMSLPDLIAQRQGDRSFGLQEKQFAANQANNAFDRNIKLEDLQLRKDAADKAPTPPTGYTWNDKGGLSYIPGGPADPSKPVPSKNLRPTTDQTNAAGFYDRMNEAEKILADDKLASASVDPKNLAWARVPVYGNSKVSPEFQQYDQAKRDFINAVLRKESGAAISPGEFDNADKQYFRQYGDSEAVIKQKAQNRATAIAAMHRAGGPAFVTGGTQPIKTTDGWTIEAQ